MGLLDRLLRRRGPPRLVRHGDLLDLRFETGVAQSRMRVDAPDELVVDYTRTMLGIEQTAQSGARLVPDAPSVAMLTLAPRLITAERAEGQMIFVEGG